MTDYEKALKDAHEHADKALDKVEDAAKSARDRFKSWLDKPFYQLPQPSYLRD